MEIGQRLDLTWPRFEKAPIRYKLRLMIMLTCAVALGLAGVAFGGYELSRLRSSLELDLESGQGHQPKGVLLFDETAAGAGLLDRSYLWTLGGVVLLSLGASIAVARTLEHHIAEPLGLLAAESGVGCKNSGGYLGSSGQERDEIDAVAIRIDRLLETIEKQDKALWAAGSTFEARVRERTEAIAEARASSEAASRAKTELLENISRGLRTPLVGVIGYGDLLLRSSLDDRQRRYVKSVVSSGDALLAIVDDLLDFSRMENDRLTLEPITFDLRRFLGGAVDVARQRADSKNLVVDFEVVDSVPSLVRQDAGRLRQVLSHLLDNAVKFTVIGGISVRVTACRRDELLTLRLVVQDTGIGIPGEAMPTLFQPFTQVDAWRFRRHDGNGLGLAISRRIIDQMGGTLRAASVLGAGSTFTLEVPCEAVTEEATEAATQAELPEDSLPLQVEGLTRMGKILLVEDNDLNRIYVTEQLRALGHDPVVAINGHKALALLETEPLDLVLMDCQMPGLDGYETTRCLRNREGTDEHIPIVAVTADAAVGDRERCLAAGMDDVLTKPFRTRDLEAVIGRWLPAEGPGAYPWTVGPVIDAHYARG